MMSEHELHKLTGIRQHDAQTLMARGLAAHHLGATRQSGRRATSGTSPSC